MATVFLLLLSQSLLRTSLVCSPSQNVFVFWYSHMIANFEFTILVIMFSTIVNRGIRINISRLHFDCSMMYVVIFVNYFLWIIEVHIFWYCSHMLVNFVLQGSDKSFCNNKFSFIVCWIHFSSIFMQQWLHCSILKLTTLTYPYSVWFKTKVIQNFLKRVSDYNIFLVFQWNNPYIFPINIHL